MKRSFMMLVAVAAVLALAMPAMAVETSMTGSYRVRGFYIDNLGLDDDSPSQAWMDMRFRLRTIFKVNDRVTIDTRFDALDNVMFGTGDIDPGLGNNSYDIDVDRIEMQIATDWGVFKLGRMQTGTWGGTTWGDAEGDGDFIQWYIPYGKWLFGFGYQHIAEGDVLANPPAPNIYTDNDMGRVFPYAVYYHEYATISAIYVYLWASADDFAPLAGYLVAQETGMNVLDLAVVGQYGPFRYQGEIYQYWGEYDYDTSSGNYALDPDGAGPLPPLTDGVDIDYFGWFVEGGYSFGPVEIMAGYSFNTGDTGQPDAGFANDGDDTTVASFTYGTDWDRLWILHNSEDLYSGNLRNAAFGNIENVRFVNPAAGFGQSVFWLGASYSPLENLKLTVLWGTSKADEVRPGWDDDHGDEFDLQVDWQVMDNLEYTAIFAYLNAGDFWRGNTSAPTSWAGDWMGPANVQQQLDDTFSIYQALTVSF